MKREIFFGIKSTMRHHALKGGVFVKFLDIIIFILIAGLPLSSAFFIYYNQSLQKSYSAGDTVKGKVVLGFNNEEALSIFTSNLAGNISLKDLLQAQEFEQGIDYNCSTANCMSSYAAQNFVRQLSFGGEHKLGLKFIGQDITDITSASFRIESNIPASCYPQISLDIGEQKKYFFMNSAYTSNSCFAKNYGCFDAGASSAVEATLSTTAYCSNLSLPTAPAYLLGARVKNSTQGNGILKMQLRSLEDNSLLKECILPNQTEQIQEIECAVEHLTLQQKNYLVCILGNGNSNYKILSETSAPLCGSDDGGASYAIDYEIFARSLEFNKINITINDSIFEKFYGQSFSSYLFDYLKETYNGRCLPSCSVPLSMFGSAQELSFGLVDIKYKSGNTLREEHELYNIEEQSARINSGAVELEISQAGFILPYNAKGNVSFELFLNNSKIFSRPIVFNVQESFNFSISPLSFFVGVPTLFLVTGITNIADISWDFGDGTSVIQGSNVTHTYREEKNYRVSVTLTRKDGVSVNKNFIVSSGNSALSASILLQQKKAQLQEIQNNLNSFPSWINDILQESINLTGMKKSLNELDIIYNASLSEENNSSALVQDILALEIPERIAVSKSGTLPLISGAENIDPDFLKDIFDEEPIRDRDSIKKTIPVWMEEHYTSTADFQVIYSYSRGTAEPLASYFTLHITPKNNNISGPIYLIMDYPLEAITFKTNYGQSTISSGTSSGTALPLENNRDIEFIILEDLSIAELGAYISPMPEKLFPKLSLFAKAINRWGKARVYFVLLFLGVFVLYIILQEWYKKHYEGRLFKQQYELYNIINFIYNARVSGLRDNEIASKLKHSGWTGEQVNYAFKKIDGRRTGMYEIPIFKFLEQRKVRQEIMKRQQRPIDVRFIKRQFSGEI